MRIEALTSAKEVAALLTECALPVEDISVSSPPLFFGIHVDSALVAVIGLELYPPFGLLRSLAVRSDFRNRGFGHELVAFLESYSVAHGVESLFLITNTADLFFRRMGYSSAPRSSAPPAIKATAQFSSLCPASSAFLSKNIAVQANPSTNTDAGDKAAGAGYVKR